MIELQDRLPYHTFELMSRTVKISSSHHLYGTSPHSSIMSTNNTIKFNVGGKHFEVSRDLIEAHSETMLGKLVSEAWQADPEEAVFIDRNGDIFAYVLDYLRYGSIELPPAIPKSSFERDLDFYGLVPKEGEIKDKSFADITASLLQDCDSAKLNLDDAQSKYQMSLFAAEVNHQYIVKKRSSEEVVQISADTVRVNDDLKKRCQYLHDAEEKLFLNYLDQYFGLRMATESECVKEGISSYSFKNASPYASPNTPHMHPGKYFYVIRK